MFWTEFAIYDHCLNYSFIRIAVHKFHCIHWWNLSFLHVNISMKGIKIVVDEFLEMNASLLVQK